ncbi:MAG TPA: hypothetical protein VH142_00835 [Polyangiaceae bacterium]|jgi:hypothetical protein|nr:hypothetical protein [Polyangiaceae bacterium]
MKARSLLLICAVSCFSAFVAPSVLAQVSDADRNAARDLYVEGVALQKAGKYQEALDRLQRSLAVYPVAPTTAYHMAQCKEALGQLVEAAEQLRLVRDTPLPPGASEAFAQAKTDAAAELTQLEGRIPKLKIEILPAGVQGLVVTIDGAQTPTALIGVPRPINPGTHHIVAQAPGYTPGQQQVDVRERQQPAPEITITLQPGAGGVQYSNVPNNNPPNNGGGYQNPNGGYQGGGYGGAYGTWIPPRRRPEGSHNALLIGIDGALTVPFGDVVQGGSTGNLLDQLGIGGAFGVDIGLRLARVIYLGAWLQGSAFGGNSNIVGTTGGGAFAADGVFGLMSGPDSAGVYFELGGGVRYTGASDGNSITQGEFLIGIGAQVKAGNFRFIPKIDFFIDPEQNAFHGFFTLGIVGYWELPLDKPMPQQPNDPNAAPPPPAY